MVSLLQQATRDRPGLVQPAAIFCTEHVECLDCRLMTCLQADAGSLEHLRRGEWCPASLQLRQRRPQSTLEPIHDLSLCESGDLASGAVQVTGAYRGDLFLGS